MFQGLMYYAQHQQMLADATIPGSAARDFYSGNFFGWLEVDIWGEMQTCFPDDDELSGYLDQMMGYYKTEDWEAYKAELMITTTRFNNLVNDKCGENDAIMEVVQEAADVSTEFFAQENWEDIIKKNIEDNQEAWDGFGLQAEKAWEDGKYYESGNLSGLLTEIMYRMPEDTIFLA